MTKINLIEILRLLSSVETLLSLPEIRQKVPDITWEQLSDFTDLITEELNK